MQFTTKIPERDGYYWLLNTDWAVPFPAYFDGRGREGKFYASSLGSYGLQASMMHDFRYQVGDKIEMPEQSKVRLEKRTVTVTSVPTDEQITTAINQR